ncbi:DUF4129 domain-containing protein [Rhodanobacter sp. 7MK24]|uniref:DUF4129 domain-containing protein n=1 Tax=Rhodanobacter sp. 7MK24 TaxID=2775922 RepID=UPI00177BBE14|nr:DUF4129 domain-containing protein [Rhodanobacter sp. 7MK24]MBD8878931.1 DUF4129 domain-containing protein [Rhodanobacter sp. 7MK24]
MELERISVVLRPRESREALDLGAAMLRANAGAVWLAWFAFSVPLFVLCNALGLLLGLPWLGLLLVWWLKPLFDRVPLYVLSRAVFDRAPRWRESLRGQRALPWGPTMAGLSWLRIDSHRALRLPLELLEGAPRRQRVARWKVLRRKLVGEASLLAWGCLQFELVLFLSAWLLALWLLPQEWRPASFADFFRHEVHGAATAWTLAASAVDYLAMSVIEPLYVACGFALYLNRRTELEAWDIDLAFRRLRARLQDLGKLLCLLLCLGLPLAGHAATPTPKAAPVSTPQQVFRQPLDDGDQRFAAAAAQVYRDPRFGGERHVRRWELKYASRPAQPVNMGMAPLRLLSGVLNALLWLALAAAVAALAWFAWRWSGGLREQSPLPSFEAKLSTTVDATPEALPRDVAGAARELWQAQRRREALALLYRGCAERIAQQLQLPFAVDATEADWLRHATALDDPARTRRVAAIVRTWQFAAYAGRYPDQVAFERLLDGWPLQPEAAA